MKEKENVRKNVNVVRIVLYLLFTIGGPKDQTIRKKGENGKLDRPNVLSLIRGRSTFIFVLFLSSNGLEGPQ